MNYDMPDFAERKGSLNLRSDHMNYSRAILNSNWHQARESEPKDYDLNRAPERDLSKASYHRIGNVTDGSLPSTEYQDMSKQVYLKPMFSERPDQGHEPMVDEKNLQYTHIDRDTGDPERGYGAVLPRHHPDFDKFYLETTHRADFTPPYPFERAEAKPAEFQDKSLAYKKCHSQFTDTADYRRPGRNTWMDESGIYANAHFKREVYPVHNPIPEQLK
ncbi:hypothetical protein BaRGS_00019299 [Batillaria attramentaria]|uniref:Uncharacterized protein n=1 Tax=Batillaria attramentaria TaxID=370345 RepID=A0ABD0KQU7_9CAEN